MTKNIKSAIGYLCQELQITFAFMYTMGNIKIEKSSFQNILLIYQY
jgi:hypothetical protein